MKAIEGIIYSGQVHPSEPLEVKDYARCVIVILEESLGDLRAEEQASFDPAKRSRLSALLDLNRAGRITHEQEHEMDELLAQSYELAARKAPAARLLEQFSPA